MQMDEEDSRDRIIIELKEANRILQEKAGDKSYLDISEDAIRLHRAIKRCEKRQRRKGISDDTFIKLSNNMAYLIQTKLPLVDNILKVKKLLKQLQ